MTAEELTEVHPIIRVKDVSDAEIPRVLIYKARTPFLTVEVEGLAAEVILRTGDELRAMLPYEVFSNLVDEVLSTEEFTAERKVSELTALLKVHKMRLDNDFVGLMQELLTNLGLDGWDSSSLAETEE